MEERELYHITAYGIKVKKCCASCSHMQPDNKTRVCMKGEGLVAPTSYCLDWNLRKGLENAGKGGGTVKKHSYLQYCLEVIDDDNARVIEYAQKKLLYKRKTIDQIRESYRKKHGDIFVI